MVLLICTRLQFAYAYVYSYIYGRPPVVAFKTPSALGNKTETAVRNILEAFFFFFSGSFLSCGVFISND